MASGWPLQPKAIGAADAADTDHTQRFLGLTSPQRIRAGEATAGVRRCSPRDSAARRAACPPGAPHTARSFMGRRRHLLLAVSDSVHLSAGRVCVCALQSTRRNGTNARRSQRHLFRPVVETDDAGGPRKLASAGRTRETHEPLEQPVEKRRANKNALTR